MISVYLMQNYEEEFFVGLPAALLEFGVGVVPVAFPTLFAGLGASTLSVDAARNVVPGNAVAAAGHLDENSAFGL